MIPSAYSPMLERKRAFIIAAFDHLMELEYLFQEKEGYTNTFEALVDALHAYPIGVCPVSGASKSLVYFADSLILWALAVLWKRELTPSDVELTSELLENAFENLCSSKIYHTL